ncbi:MAG: hypothetical protein HZB38_17870 [Planctomycetes bacterium]|nr:hypothetical protein [Planctomycetota bacterium]
MKFAPLVARWFGTIAAFVSPGCLSVHSEREYSCRWHELRPPPSNSQIDRFRALYATVPVTTTQPGSWSNIEVGMSRGMVRTLAGDRLRDPRPWDVARLDQQSPQFHQCEVRLYFEHSPGDATPSSEDDVLQAIIIHDTTNRPVFSTDWP